MALNYEYFDEPLTELPYEPTHAGPAAGLQEHYSDTSLQYPAMRSYFLGNKPLVLGDEVALLTPVKLDGYTLTPGKKIAPIHIAAAVEQMAAMPVPRRDEPVPYEPTPRERTDQILKDGFRDAVGRLSLAAVIHLGPKQAKAKREPRMPRNLGRYKLIAVGRTSYYSGRIDMPDDTLPEGITCNYKEPGGAPFLDTSVAIGLAYDDVLIALAGGMAYGQGVLIKQLQAKVLSNMDEEQRRRSGLHGGFRWRDTLVEAWRDVCRQLDIGTITVQGAINNGWSRVHGKNDEKGKPRKVPKPRTDLYDDVAERLDFKPDDRGNWVYRIG